MTITDIDIALRLLLSLLLGGLIGLERESHKRPAGFRTHILVCMGSTLVMLISIYGFDELVRATGMTRDPARLAAQVVSGIGFLGAGTILREGPTVKGLTTAASLWVVAGIGLAVGVGFYFAAGLTTILAVLTLVILDKVERKWLLTKHHDHLVIRVSDRPGRLGTIAAILGNHGVNITDVEITPGSDGSEAILDLLVTIPSHVQKVLLLEDISRVDGVFKAEYEGDDW